MPPAKPFDFKPLQPLSSGFVLPASHPRWIPRDLGLHVSRSYENAAERTSQANLPWELTIKTDWAPPDTLRGSASHIVVERVPLRWGLALSNTPNHVYVTASFAWQKPLIPSEQERILWVGSPVCNVRSWVPIHESFIHSVLWSKALFHIEYLRPDAEVLRTLRSLVGTEGRQPSFWAQFSLTSPSLMHHYTVPTYRTVGLVFQFSIEETIRLRSSDPSFSHDIAPEPTNGE